MENQAKTKEEILNQIYLSAYDLQILNPTMSYVKALSYIKKKRKEMEEQKLYVPDGRTKVALTKLIKKEWGI